MIICKLMLKISNTFSFFSPHGSAALLGQGLLIIGFTITLRLTVLGMTPLDE
jgi:hypothetical protein